MNCGAQCNTFMLLIQQANVDPVGDPACWQRRNPRCVSLAHFLRVTLQTQHTQIHQFTQHEQLLHFRNLTQQSRTQRSRLLPRLCVYLLLHSRILSLLFVVLLLCVLDSLSVFHPLRPFFSTNSSHRFLTFVGSPNTPSFYLPPPHD